MAKQSKRHMGLEVQGDLVTSNSLMFRNKIINGNFDIWQRGTSGTAAGPGLFMADRWKTTITATGINYTYAQSTDVPNLTSLYSAKITQSAAGPATSAVEYALRQVVEMSNALQFVGKSITVSFWYKSSIAGTHGIRMVAANMTGGTDLNTEFTINSANTWQYITATFSSAQAVTAITGTANGVGLYLDIGFRVSGGSGPVGQSTVPANASFNIAQVQLEAGSSASAFEHRPHGMELQLCQRYFQWNSPGSGKFNIYGTQFAGTVPLLVPMRAQPSILFTSPVSGGIDELYVNRRDITGNFNFYDAILVAGNFHGGQLLCAASGNGSGIGNYVANKFQLSAEL